MKPIQTNKLKEFLERFDNFKNAEFRSIDIISPIQISFLFAVQDSAREFDWLTIKLEFNGVNDAKLLDKNKYSLADMSDGISLLYKNNSFYFALGNYNSESNITNSSCYVIAQNVKYEEGSF